MDVALLVNPASEPTSFERARQMIDEVLERNCVLMNKVLDPCDAMTVTFDASNVVWRVSYPYGSQEHKLIDADDAPVCVSRTPKKSTAVELSGTESEVQGKFMLQMVI